MDLTKEIDFMPLIIHNSNSDSNSTIDSKLPRQEETPSEELDVQSRQTSKRRGKKRSSRACASCRYRKVRCDIVQHGSPCSNCRHDEVECVLPLSRRQRAVRERLDLETQELTQIKNSNSDNGRGAGLIPSIENEQKAFSERSCKPILYSNLSPHGLPMAEYPLAEILPAHSISQCQTRAHSPSISGDQYSTHSQVSPQKEKVTWRELHLPLETAPNHILSTTQFIPNTTPPKLPSIFTAFPNRVKSIDIEYLHRRDAVTLPSPALQLALLKVYGEFIHSNFPILDLGEFLSTVQNSSGKEKQTSLLLFQAVMFAGAEYVGFRALKEEGYKSREEARTVLFSRVRLLYDFDTATSRLEILQSLLLMTLHHTPPQHPSPDSDYKDAYHYLNLALSLCYSMDLNRLTHSALMQSQLERRIWWSAFIRDRVLALEQGSRGVIRREDCAVGMVQMEDFEDDGGDEMDALRTRRDASMFIERARLCWFSSEVGVADVFGRNTALEGMQIPLSVDPLSMGVNLGQQRQREIVENGRLVFQNHSPIFSTNASQSPDCNHSQSHSHSPRSQNEEESCATPTPEPRTGEANSYIRCDSPLVVDGEYDNYLEYLRSVVVEDEITGASVKKPGNKEPEQGMEKSGGMAWQLDCERGVIMEV